MRTTLQDLEALAHERSSEKRRALLHAISDCFFRSDDRTDSETALYDEVVTRVLDEVEPMARAELAQLLADIAAPPRRTLLQLAQDVIAVAEPILARSPALSDTDLEHIARNHSQEHLAAIASRPTLSEQVTDVLVDRGNDHVVDAVAANHGARISEKSFATLADRAGSNEALLERLSTRGDLPAEISARLAPLISKAIGDKLKDAGESVDTAVLNGLANESREVLADRLRAATKMARSLDVLVDLLERRLIKLDEAVIELADVDATPDVAKLLADHVELRFDTVMRALCAPADDPVALLCRAAALKMNGYSAIVRMRRRRRRGPEASPSQVLEQYQHIPLDTAQRVMRFLKVRETAEAAS
jgi:uncharacterized protein (DUF2336 family)